MTITATEARAKTRRLEGKISQCYERLDVARSHLRSAEGVHAKLALACIERAIEVVCHTGAKPGE